MAGEVFGKQQKEIVVFAREPGEFVANLVSANLEDVMVLSSIDAQLGTSEFELSRLTPEPISFARFPRVKEVFAALECKLTEIWRPRSLTNPENAPFVVTGEVIDVHIDERVLTNGLIDIAKVRPVSRLGYFDYLVTKETFAKFRPQWVSTSEG